MVKGVSRRVIVVESPDPRIFEQAIFILPTDGGGVSSRQLVDQAVRIARSYARGQGGVHLRRHLIQRGVQHLALQYLAPAGEAHRQGQRDGDKGVGIEALGVLDGDPRPEEGALEGAHQIQMGDKLGGVRLAER